LEARDAPAPCQNPKNPDPEGSDWHHVSLRGPPLFIGRHDCAPAIKAQASALPYTAATLWPHQTEKREKWSGREVKIRGGDRPLPRETPPSSSRSPARSGTTLLLGYAALTHHGIATRSTPPPMVSPAVRPSLSFAHRSRVRNGNTNAHGHSLDAPYQERFGRRPELVPHPRTCTRKHGQAAAFVEPRSRENADVAPKNGAHSPWLELTMVRSHSGLLEPVAI
jgi:hypothetical protein